MHKTTFEQMFGNDFGYISVGQATIHNPLWINNYGGPEFAPTETARIDYFYFRQQLMLSEFFEEALLNRKTIFEGAVSASAD